ncbi:hypothetical protein H072_4540 [Dactylellina haptotyla CBS 200.50]|uniref:Uncharacterized protein n=1 Tax=Dactylellina haptotyla (strain CBS 200.50) TaxID=1284197 RepID=S8C1R1_DACHA|nr:hypothetical protein H072_4540 [Dactylellina haptotyla CBS 200.50]
MHFVKHFLILALSLPLAFCAVIPLEGRGHDTKKAIESTGAHELYAATNHVDVTKRGHDAASKAQGGDVYDFPHIAVDKRGHDAAGSRIAGGSPELYAADHVSVEKRGHIDAAAPAVAHTEIYASDHINVG